jgi:U3 small nucleolar RNA-associated protein 20
MFIKDEAYTKAGNLHDASVEAVGAICRQLPWQRYVTVLKFFLMRMSKSLEKHKLAVRSVFGVIYK